MVKKICTDNFFQNLPFLGQKYIACGEKSRFWAFLLFFTTSDVFLAQKRQNSKKLSVHMFLTIFFYNLAKYEVHSTSRAKALGKSVK